MKLTYISALRSLSILMVVFFHVYGYMFADHFLETKQIYEETYFWINNCVIINVAMPLFTFISGYLFEYLWVEKKKYQEFIPFIFKKFQRLWIPFFCFGLIMMATTNNWHPAKLLEGGYWHLWYLPRLFWCFIIAWCINKWITNGTIRLVLFPIFLFYPLTGWHIPTFIGLQGVTVWLGYFFMGVIFYDHKEIISRVVIEYRLYIPLLILWAWINYMYPVEYGERTWYSILASFAVILNLWSIFRNFGESVLNKMQPLVWLSTYSFGIYIFHNWVGLYLVGHLSQRLFHLPEFASSHILLFPLILSFTDLFISLFLSWTFMKTKVGKYLIG